MFERFWDYQGDEKRDNPFRSLRFKNVVYKDIPAFENEWIENEILAPGALDALNLEARCIVLALIETGCRPSEVANITCFERTSDGRLATEADEQSYHSF